MATVRACFPNFDRVDSVHVGFCPIFELGCRWNWSIDETLQRKDLLTVELRTVKLALRGRTFLAAGEKGIRNFYRRIDVDMIAELPFGFDALAKEIPGCCLSAKETSV